MQRQNKSRKNISIALGVIVVLIIVTTIVFSEKGSSAVASSDQTSSQAQAIGGTTPSVLGESDESGQSNESGESEGLPTQAAMPPVDTIKKSTSLYKDGSYSATGSYMSPGGEDQIGVTVTLKNNIITDVSVVSGAQDRTSQRYQDRFISGYKQYVVGKNIATLSVGRVSGSSLTPIGFNAALSAIRTKAKIA